MFLRRISIRNFKTIRSLDVDLSEGLNVVFGPNEAGKSTFLEALTAAFFTNADSGSSQVVNFRPWNSEADPVIAVTFMAGGNEYTLEKTFLGLRRGRLHCTARGLDTTNKDRINEELAQLFPFGILSEDAHKRTFWIPQRELEDTLGSLPQDPDIRSALRSAILRADGDIEAIKSAIVAKIREMGKGTQRLALFPGPLVQAEQVKENLEKEVRDLRTKLSALERDVARHKELTGKVRSLEKQIEDDGAVIAAAGKYGDAKKALESANRNFDSLQEALESYQTGQAALHDAKPKLLELEKQLREADTTIKAAVATEEVQRIQAKLQDEEGLLRTIQKLDEQIAATRAGIDSVKQIAKTDLDSARNLEKAIESKREALKAAQLSVEAKGLSDVHLSIAEDQGPEHPENVGKDESKTFRANQRIVLTVPGVVLLSLSSGVKSAIGLQNELDVTLNSRASLLAKCGVDSLESLSTAYEAQQKLQREIANIENEKKGSLRGRPVAALEASIKSLRAQKDERTLHAASAGLKSGDTVDSWRSRKDQIVREQAGLNAQVTQLEQTGKRFIQTYQSLESALAKKKELAREMAKSEAALDETPKVEIPDDQMFLRKRNLENSKTEYASSQRELLLLTGALQTTPVSSDQLSLKEAELAEAKAAYDANLLEYEAYKTLQETIAEAEVEVSQHLTDPIREIVSTLLPALTNGRYSGVHLDESLMINAASFEGQDIDPDDLSTGAKGQLALAVRLALIEHLSGHERQMVVIDDALVNFDAARLGGAKALLNEFSKKHQVIYLSCHEEMRVGKVLEL